MLLHKQVNTQKTASDRWAIEKQNPCMGKKKLMTYLGGLLDRLIIKTTGKTVYNPHQSAVPVFAMSFLSIDKISFSGMGVL